MSSWHNHTRNNEPAAMASSSSNAAAIDGVGDAAPAPAAAAPTTSARRRPRMTLAEAVAGFERSELWKDLEARMNALPPGVPESARGPAWMPPAFVPRAAPPPDAAVAAPAAATAAAARPSSQPTVLGWRRCRSCSGHDAADDDGRGATKLSRRF